MKLSAAATVIVLPQMSSSSTAPSGELLPANELKIDIYTSRPGIIIGRKGSEVDRLKEDIRKRTQREVFINILEIDKPEIDAQLVADSIAQQLEKRIMFRRAMKRAMQNAMRLGAQECHLVKGTQAHKVYGKDVIVERHRHRYEFNNAYREQLTKAGLILSGVSPDEELVEIVELPEHRWFVSSQFHPEFTSNPRDGHPLFVGFVEAARRYRAEQMTGPARASASVGARSIASAPANATMPAGRQRAGAGAHVDQIVGRADRVLVVLYHQHRISDVRQIAQGTDQPLIIALMQANRRFIKHIHHAHQACANLRRQANALRFATGKAIGFTLQA